MERWSNLVDDVALRLLQAIHQLIWGDGRGGSIPTRVITALTKPPGTLRLEGTPSTISRKQ